MRKRRIAILGSTGSIGTQTLDVIRRHPDMFEVELISARRNVDLLTKQAIEFDAANVVICEESKYKETADALQDKGIKVWSGVDSLCELVKMSSVDIVVGAMVGFSGLRPTLAALEAGKTVALANKETLVAAGPIVIRTMLEQCRHTAGGFRALRHFSMSARIQRQQCGKNSPDSLRRTVPYLGKSPNCGSYGTTGPQAP